MVLVDTSVWIRALRLREPYRTELDKLLDSEKVSAHPLVYGELLIGDHRIRRRLLQDYPTFHQIPVSDHNEVVALVVGRGLNGKGIGWIDAHLLASTLTSSSKLWTADIRLRTIAQELGVAYSAPRLN